MTIQPFDPNDPLYIEQQLLLKKAADEADEELKAKSAMVAADIAKSATSTEAITDTVASPALLNPIQSSVRKVQKTGAAEAGKMRGRHYKRPDTQGLTNLGKKV